MTQSASRSPRSEPGLGATGELHRANSSPQGSRESSPAPTGTASSPTVRRRILAAELKNLRHAAGLTHVDVAHRLGWQQGKVSKIEGARQGVPVEVVIALAELCHATPDHRDRLVEIAKAARVRPWWEPYGDMLTPEGKTYLGLETDADAIELFAMETIPELVQTAEYAAQVLATRLKAEEPGALVRERVDQVRRQCEMLRERQRNALEARRTQIDLVVSEAALVRSVGTECTLREQLAHLADVARRPNAVLRVFPFSAGPCPVDASFTVFQFGTQPHPDVVCVPHRTGAIHVEQQQEVEMYRTLLRELRSRSLSVEDSLQLLQRLSSGAAREVVP